MKLHGVLQRESSPMKKVDLDYDISYEGPGDYRKYMAVARINGVPYGKGVAWPHKSAAKELACKEALERWKAKTPLEGIPPREEEPRGRGKKKKPRKDKNMNLEREGSAGSLVTKMDDSENLLLIREL
ncbi:uncharacterized protein LAESUDRAFT_676167 [Laetiporus sulphureus 93-53]|uniref:DRBM domain-containing protein n=1 Tax=Laetiporus sulphureus 93-53 TaxID=1314785 RepID=A0A165FC83_9APHY|nr:uncharacterized protein LAESUDRAFT_676167 [Laetiporus sulphureus 93-53]KZT08750.1 hypothetical protein LAESUDRAFT_676167 [Laetiporus sulphureus 93-53]